VARDLFPKQGRHLGVRVAVAFEPSERGDPLFGVIVCEDAEPPYATIIRLDDGRHVIGDECIYSTDTGALARPEAARGRIRQVQR